MNLTGKIQFYEFEFDRFQAEIINEGDSQKSSFFTFPCGLGSYFATYCKMGSRQLVALIY